MTAAEHLVEAERYMTAAAHSRPDDMGYERLDFIGLAQVHLLAAIAIELGVPPVTAAPGGGQ